MTKTSTEVVEALKQRVAEVVEEGDGFWQACSGCQEGADGYVPTTDYPYSHVFRCQPGGGCSECGGIGVIWDDTDYEDYAKFALELDKTERSAARLLEELQTHVEAADKQVEPGQFGKECIAFANGLGKTATASSQS